MDREKGMEGRMNISDTQTDKHTVSQMDGRMDSQTKNTGRQKDSQTARMDCQADAETDAHI